MNMAISLPLVVDSQLISSSFIAGGDDKSVALVTTLHQIGNGRNIHIAIPEHGGDVSIPQTYPFVNIRAFKINLALAEPFLDLAIMLLPRFPGLIVPTFPNFINSADEIKVGEEVIVVGYPFAPMDSILETVQICYVSALGIRQMGVATRREIILSAQTYSGSSGSPVLRRSDGKVCGVVRGCLALPSGLNVGNMPLGSDSNITYATSAHIIPTLVKEALNNG